MKEAQTSLGRLANTQEYIQELADKTWPSAKERESELVRKAAECRAAFDEAMEDDFNTALAISQMFALSKEINIYYQEVANSGKGFDAEAFAEVKGIWDDMADILGLFEQKKGAEDDGLTEKLMSLIAAIRQEARQNKNWALADRIRDDLKDLGIVLEDTPNGVRWKRI